MVVVDVLDELVVEVDVLLELVVEVVSISLFDGVVSIGSEVSSISPPQATIKRSAKAKNFFISIYSFL